MHTALRVLGVAAAGFLLVHAMTNPHRGWIRLWVQHRRPPEASDLPMLGLILYVLLGYLPELFGAADQVALVTEVLGNVLFVVCALGGLTYWLRTRRTARPGPRPTPPSGDSSAPPATGEAQPPATGTPAGSS